MCFRVTSESPPPPFLEPRHETRLESGDLLDLSPQLVLFRLNPGL